MLHVAFPFAFYNTNKRPFTKHKFILPSCPENP